MQWESEKPALKITQINEETIRHAKKGKEWIAWGLMYVSWKFSMTVIPSPLKLKFSFSGTAHETLASTSSPDIDKNYGKML